MEQERINEGLRELNCEERENFTRYGFVFFIIINYLKREIFSIKTEVCRGKEKHETEIRKN